MNENFSTEEFARLSHQYYSEIKEDLEKTSLGKYVALDYENKNFYLGDSASEAIFAGQVVHPDKLFYVLCVGETSTLNTQAIEVNNIKPGYRHDFKWAY